MEQVNSIIESLYQHSINKPHEVAYEFITELSAPTQTISYKQLYDEVEQIAQGLLQKVNAGDGVLLLYPPSIEYIKAYFACVMAGVVAIPLYPPKKNTKSDKVFIVAKASKAKVALTSDKELEAIEAFWQQNSTLAMSLIGTSQLQQSGVAEPVALPTISADKPAFLQYTSGSTGDPKGVIITQGNILANTMYLERLSGANQADVFVNWLPLFHDLGLVTAILLPAYLGVKSVLMAPATFVRDPVIWFQAITRYGGTIGGAPNFAFDLCTDKIKEQALAEVDLSSWRIAYNAAEPVKHETLDRFAQRFGAYGFKLDSFYPSYGMAESTAFISGGHGNDPLEVIAIDKKALADNQVLTESVKDPLKFVANGFCDQFHDLKIVDPQTKMPLAEGEIGQVWFSGPSVSPGYWQLDEVSKQTFGNTLADGSSTKYLNTGDLGFILNQQLYITGRSKDMLILKGKNYYPQDLEATIKYCDDQLHPGYCAAFELDQRLVIVAEVNRNALKTLKPQALIQQMSRQIYNEHDISVDDVVLLPPYKIPVTSSGKIRRRQTKKLYQLQKLPSLYQKQTSQTRIAPSNEVESAIHQIWCSVLDLDGICVERGFFELGGDSITATEIALGVSQHYSQLKLDENQILQCISIKTMAELIIEAQTGQAQPIKAALPPYVAQVSGEQYQAPSSNLQRNIYFLESLAMGQSFYNVPSAFELEGEVDVNALRQAIATLCQKFDILRTVYQYIGDGLAQIVEPFEFERLPFSVVEVSSAQLGDKLTAEANFNFDLSSHWPIKAVLFVAGRRQVLSLTMHHIAIDGYSAKMIINALSEAYGYHLQGGDKAPLQHPVFSAPQYADYAHWHQQYLQSSACEQARAYWRQRLENAPSCHNFPLEFARPSTLSVEGDVLYHQIDGQLFDKIQQSAKQQNSSVFLLLQSLFAGFMARYSDQQDVLISSVYANRDPSAFSHSVGMFANTIPFRYQLDQHSDMGHLLQSTLQQHHLAQQHQSFPFELMLEGLNIERDPSYNPLVQVQFVLQQDPLSDFGLQGLEVQSINNRQAVAKFDFSLHLYINDNDIQLQWEFNTNLFSKTRLELILSHWLEFVAHHLDNEFAKLMLFQFGQVPVNRVHRDNFNPYISNPELIAQYGDRQPKAIAVQDGDQTLTYAQLVQQGHRLIAGLQQQGLVAGDRVAVYMNKSVNQVITMFALMRAGFVYVPLDPAYPQERLAYIGENAEAKALLHEQSLVPNAEIVGSIPLFEFAQLVANSKPATLTSLTEEQGAYIIYTSGSTGKPKGVLVPHGSIYFSLQANRKVYNFQAQDIMPTVGSQAFGVSLLETFVPLLSGGTVLILNKPQVADIATLIATTQEVTVMHMVPSLMAQWLDQIEHDSRLYPKLRLLLVGAEPVPPILLTRLKAWRENVVIRVLYGMTESSVVSSGYLSNEHDGKGYSIGKPHPNMRFYTMNQYGVPQPVGVGGELYVGGLSLASGYVGLPQQTAQKFIKHPLLHERLYKTGDRARLLPSGHFEFLGRTDHQVSLRGIRIETGEIESLINQLEPVKKCIAHVMPLENGDHKFVLYYTSYESNPKEQVEPLIKATLVKSVPESMRPSIFMALEAFEHNPNGKVDRKKLPKPSSDSTYVKPSSATELYLHQQWCEMLELDKVSIKDNFFELGGHSLMATKLINNINQHFSIELPLKRFFTASTIFDCAAVIDEEVDNSYLSQLVIKDDTVEATQEVDEFVI